RCIVCVVFAAAGVVRAQPPDDPAALARRLYERYAAGDLEGMMALWSPDAAEAKAFRNRIAGVLRTRCVEIPNVEITRAEAKGDRAEVDVAASLLKYSRSLPPRAEKELATLMLTRKAGGPWLLTGWKRQEEALADLLMAAKSADERAEILHQHPSLGTTALADILSRRAIQFINQQRYAEAMQLMELVERIGVERRDLVALSSAYSIESQVFRLRRPWNPEASSRLAHDAVALAEASGDRTQLA